MQAINEFKMLNLKVNHHRETVKFTLRITYLIYTSLFSSYIIIVVLPSLFWRCLWVDH